MKPIRKTQIISLFMVCCLLMAAFAAPASLAVLREDEATMLESDDWNVVTVNGKKAFTLTIQDFSDAYDTLVTQFAEEPEDKTRYLLNLVQTDENNADKLSKIDIDGARIELHGTRKNSKVDATEANITKIVAEIPMIDRNDPTSARIMAAVTLIICNYEEDVTLAMVKRISAGIDAEKSKIAFSRGNLRFVVSFPEDAFTLCTITVTPK